MQSPEDGQRLQIQTGAYLEGEDLSNPDCENLSPTKLKSNYHTKKKVKTNVKVNQRKREGQKKIKKLQNLAEAETKKVCSQT